MFNPLEGRCLFSDDDRAFWEWEVLPPPKPLPLPPPPLFETEDEVEEDLGEIL